MTPKERRTVAEATAKLVGGPYSMERFGEHYACVVRDGLRMRDASGRVIEFHLVDAEKIARLFNMDALDDAG